MRLRANTQPKGDLTLSTGEGPVFVYGGEQQLRSPNRSGSNEMKGEDGRANHEAHGGLMGDFSEAEGSREPCRIADSACCNPA